MVQSEFALAATPAVLPSTCTLYRGDCLEVMPTLDANSVAMVFADLPFGVTRCVWDSVLPLDIYWQRLAALCKKRCAHIMPATNPFASKLILSNSKYFRYDIVWHKSRTTGFLNARKMPLRAHELMLVFYQSLPTYNPQMRTNASGRSGKFVRAETITKVYEKQHKGEHVHFLGAPLLPHSVVQMKTPNSERGLHPTQKPLALLEWLIATYTNPGDTVLDPCMGSGTSGVACARLGRNFIGIEKDDGYFNVASKRIEDERKKLGLA